MKNIATLTIFLFFTGFLASSQTNFKTHILNRIPDFDSLIQKWNTDNTPGLSVTIVENNSIIYAKNVGMANLSTKDKITSKTTFNLASLTKQFVAYSILLLEEGGKLSLDDNIQKYLPEMKYKDLTIRHLLNHSSGIPEYWGVWTLSSFKGDSIEDIYNLLKAQKQTKFKPGDKYEYANSNYILLSLIIKRISGLALNDFARKNIFKRLGMNHTYFLMDGKKMDSNQAENYQFDGENYFATPQQKSDIIGDGGLFSNVEDLIIWNKTFYNNSALSNKRKEVGVLNSGLSSLYGAGLQKYVKGGIHSYEHGGGAQGASCYLAQFPDYNISIIVLANTDDVNAVAIYRAIEAIIFSKGKHRTDSLEINNSDWHKFDATKLMSFEGKYYGFNNEAVTTFNIEIIKDTLKGNSFGNPARKYIQTNTNEFSAVDLPDLRLKIEQDGLSIHYQQFDIGSFKKINHTANIGMEKIVGVYSSSIINDGLWQISRKGGDITVLTPRLKSFTAVKISENLFVLKEMNILLLFEKETNKVYLKLIHQGAGEITLQKL